MNNSLKQTNISKVRIYIYQKLLIAIYTVYGFMRSKTTKTARF